ncbi:hypothetical protein ACJMK2_043900 [Sinanodonta woodiana]|uniref:Integrase zinc-binding domain-containing protein n=1 Tax=Sinanodonta woodiana TaxID=1069815 RepID=A0ABD3VYB0_SINWO
MPFKVKLQAYDHERGEDIVTFLAEFESIAKHAKWSDELKVLQLRTRLTGEAIYVATQACSNYLELRKGLIDRFGKRPHEHFATLVSLTKESTETYRGLMARIDQHIKPLPQEQAQWIRRNKCFSPIVEAAEDYIPANVYHRWHKNEAHPNKSGKNNNMNMHNTQKQAKLTSTSDLPNQKNMQCYRFKQWGHIARHCSTDDMKHRSNPATCFVKPSIGQRLISETGYINGREIMFVKDTGSDMTLIREDLVDKSCKLEGHKVTLYTAVGQPFTAQLAMVNIDTTYYKVPGQVGLVSNLAAEALMGMDILSTKGSFVFVPRSMLKELDNESTVVNIGQYEDEGMKEVVNKSAEMADTDKHKDIKVDKLSAVNVVLIKEKSFATREEAEEEPMSFSCENDILQRKWQSGDGSCGGKQIGVPGGLREMVMELARERPLPGYLCLEKTKERILQSLCWHGMFSDVKSYLTSCHKYQMTAKETANEQESMVFPPVTTTPYHPRANEKVEYFNGTLKSMLRKLCTDNKNEWDEMLPFLLFACREVPHEGSGFAPYGMLYGWPVRVPMKLLQGLFTGDGDVWNSTVEIVVKMHEKLAGIGFLVKDNLLDCPKKLKALYDCHAKTREFSPWSSTCVLVEKKDGTLRPCVDFRSLSTITLFDAYPVLWIDNPPVLEKIGYESHFIVGSVLITRNLCGYRRCCIRFQPVNIDIWPEHYFQHSGLCVTKDCQHLQPLLFIFPGLARTWTSDKANFKLIKILSLYVTLSKQEQSIITGSEVMGLVL